MPGAGRYIVKIENAAAGPSNPALVTFHVAGNVTTDVDDVAAQLLAMSQYLGCAAGSSTVGIEYSVAPTGPTLPVPFDVTLYGIMVGANAVLTPAVNYPVAHGAGALAALGVGAVISRRTTTPGRSGRGRFTTPWLSQNQVSATGGLVPLAATVIGQGMAAYLDGDPTIFPGSAVTDLNEYVFSSTGDHAIVSRTISARLGRLRSRTA